MHEVDKMQLLENYLKEKELYHDNMSNQEKLKVLKKLSYSYSAALHNAEYFVQNSDNSASINKWSYVASMNKEKYDQAQEYIRLISKKDKQKIKLFGRK